MTVTQLLLPNRKVAIESGHKNDGRTTEFKNNLDVRLALETGVLCNNAALDNSHETGTGDPLEIALLVAARKAGIDVRELKGKYREVKEEAFDPDVKMMATWNEIGNGRYRISVKGAPDALLEHCDSIFQGGEKHPLDQDRHSHWLRVNEDLAAEGLRIIGFAYRKTENLEENPYQNLTFIGLVGLLDPPRSDIKAAIAKCREAGIRVIMVTGDQPQTAKYIAKSIGLEEDGRLEVIHGKELPSAEELEAALQIKDLI